MFMVGTICSVIERQGIKYLKLNNGKICPVVSNGPIPFKKGDEVVYRLRTKNSATEIASIHPAVYEDEPVNIEAKAEKLLLFRGGVV